jgi:hypothetical protein
MKIIDNIVNKFGYDKVMHFLLGGWITSICSPFGWVGIIIGILIVLILSIVKEKFFDTVFDWKDIFAAMIGCVISVLIYLIIVFFIY